MLEEPGVLTVLEVLRVLNVLGVFKVLTHTSATPRKASRTETQDSSSRLNKRQIKSRNSASEFVVFNALRNSAPSSIPLV